MVADSFALQFFKGPEKPESMFQDQKSFLWQRKTP